MAKLKTLKDLRSGEKIYPLTSFSAVRDSDGRDMETRMEMLRRDIAASIPGKLSQLENDNHTVTDRAYVHTDNNLTDALKAKIEGAMEKFLPGAYLYMTPASESADGVPRLTISPDLFATLQDRFLDAGTAAALMANGVVQPAFSVGITVDPSTSTASVTDIATTAGEGAIYQLMLAQFCTEAGFGMFPAAVRVKIEGRGWLDDIPVVPVGLKLTDYDTLTCTAMVNPFEMTVKNDDGTVTLYRLPQLMAMGHPEGEGTDVTIDHAGSSPVEITRLAEAFSTSEDLRVADGVLSLTQRAKQLLFDDMWTQAVGAHGCVDHTHVDEQGRVTPYKCDIWLTYEEALAAMDAGHYLYGAAQQYGSRKDVRVNLPPAFGSNNNSVGSQQFQSSGQEVAVVARGGTGFLQVTSLPVNAFGQCAKLRRIVNMLWLTSPTATSSFPGCVALEDVRIRTAGNVDLSDSPLISLASLRYLVDDAINTGAITVWVHPNVFARLTDETDAEWYAVMSDAVEKNINFAIK